MAALACICPAGAENGLLKLLSHPKADRDAHWRQIVNDSRYRYELRRASCYFVQRYRLPVDWQGDIEHDAMLLLHRAMRRRIDLGFDPAKGRERALPWLRAVIRSHCLEAIRRLRARQRHYQPWDESFSELPARPAANWQLVLWSSMETLPGEARKLIEAYLEGGSIRAVAEETGLTWSNTRRALINNLRLLKATMNARHADTLIEWSLERRTMLIEQSRTIGGRRNRENRGGE